MKPEEDLCLCFHVSRRKVEQFIRVQKPRRASELSQCYGAGTGCGWCRPFLQRLFEAAQPDAIDLPDSEQYEADRKGFRDQKSGDD
ncbi:(2Fe-2S)-binding protein [Rhodopirellula sp. JC740]|uniref:(2Fe-2S)-binding protein n=1 Tax=Rhodopirellula halodulae TaxID=2894198 RepID=A0ABS8NMS0_9BACT|nr:MULTISPECIES: (2Fe-2S)-binding protein [unclassified Rhodopirellula]MCC9644837.1 (2Fe-2S)-binding protein [Rhodopirellula sp. JC740]MCC9657554.1 (2Fe-2S)-binding protein [Rhodopirellula sp. JC737]